MAKPEVKAGWVQVNSAVCPYVTRIPPTGSKAERLVPLLVLQHGALIEFNRPPITLKATQMEIAVMNWLCQCEGITCSFDDHTELMRLSIVSEHCYRRPFISELPFSQPLAHIKTPLLNDQGAAVPTVVLEFDEKRQGTKEPTHNTSSIAKPHCLVKSTDNTHDNHTVNRNTSADHANNSFGQQNVQGIQYIKIFKSSLLCIVKDNGKFIQLEDVHHTFFSKWSLGTFRFVLSKVLKCRINTLTRKDMEIVRKLSGESSSKVEVINVVDAWKYLIQAKVLLKKLSANRASALQKENITGKSTLLTKNKSQSAIRVIPKLSDLISANDQCRRLKDKSPLSIDRFAPTGFENSQSLGHQDHAYSRLHDDGNSNDSGKTHAISTVTKCPTIGGRVTKRNGQCVRAKKQRNLEAVLDKLYNRYSGPVQATM